MNNAQAALQAAATTYTGANAYAGGVLGMAARYKAWLDEQDALEKAAQPVRVPPLTEYDLPQPPHIKLATDDNKEPVVHGQDRTDEATGRAWCKCGAVFGPHGNTGALNKLRRHLREAGLNA